MVNSANIECLKKYKIAVLAGGCSSERDISIKSGEAVFKSLEKMGLTPRLIDIREENSIFLNNNDFDLAFIALHGRFGEDGTLQKILEEKNIKYTGSGPMASLKAMDKIKTKKILINENIKTPDFIVIEGLNDIRECPFPAPYVVKPAAEGSSVGLTIASNKKELPEAVIKAAAFGQKVIIEQYIEGREITGAILDDKSLPLVEIVPAKGVYDYNSKYDSPDTKYIVPASIGKDLYKKCQLRALMSHKVVGCRSFSRVDMRLDKSGNIYVLEINTVPGLTQRSLLPMAACARGISFDELCFNILLRSIN